MGRRRWIRIIGLVAVAIPACGGSGVSQHDATTNTDPATVSVPEPITEDEFDSLYAELGCYAYAHCRAPAG